MRFQNGCKKVAIELRAAQFWSEIILVISNETHTARLFDFEITNCIPLSSINIINLLQLLEYLQLRGFINIFSGRQLFFTDGQNFLK